jgi:hypothetical protein
MMTGISRRNVVFKLGATAAAWPFGADARKKTIPVVAVLSAGAPSGANATYKAFKAMRLGSACR